MAPLASVSGSQKLWKAVDSVPPNSPNSTRQRSTTLLPDVSGDQSPVWKSHDSGIKSCESGHRFVFPYINFTIYLICTGNFSSMLVPFFRCDDSSSVASADSPKLNDSGKVSGSDSPLMSLSQKSPKLTHSTSLAIKSVKLPPSPLCTEHAGDKSPASVCI